MTITSLSCPGPQKTPFRQLLRAKYRNTFSSLPPYLNKVNYSPFFPSKANFRHLFQVKLKYTLFFFFLNHFTLSLLSKSDAFPAFLIPHEYFGLSSPNHTGSCKPLKLTQRTQHVITSAYITVFRFRVIALPNISYILEWQAVREWGMWPDRSNEKTDSNEGMYPFPGRYAWVFRPVLKDHINSFIYS